MKKNLGRILAAVLLVAVLALTLASCGGLVASRGMCTVYVAVGEDVREYKVDLSLVEEDDGLMAVLDYLDEIEKLDVESEDSSYGEYLVSVGHAVPSGTEYVKLYTSVQKDFDTSAYFEELSYNGITFGTSGLGASSMSVPDGASFYITLGSY